MGSGSALQDALGRALRQEVSERKRSADRRLAYSAAERAASASARFLSTMRTEKMEAS
jgi:hypothetical protein